MNKHIPGPWTAHEPDEELDKYHWTIRAPGTREGMVSFEVARISGKNNDTDANTARLIAAAPDLLEVANAFASLKRYDANRDRSSANKWATLNIPVELMNKLEAAIAKATGEKE